MKIVRYITLFILLVSCHNKSTTSDSDITLTFDALLQEALDDSFDRVSGVSMSVLAPDKNVDYQGAVGFDSKSKENKLGVDQAFRIASITKPFVATAILRLHEMDSLNINDPINKYISDELAQLLKNAGYQPEDITIKHCLQHTSGLFDYAVGSNTYIEMVLKNPSRKWTRTDQVKLAMEVGSPYGSPGEFYHYSDTGYVLLGEIVERLTNRYLGQALRDLLNYDKLQLNTTWFETFEDDPQPNSTKVSRYLNNHDTTDWDASIDLFGGGGIVSTTQDLTSFSHSLFNGKIYKEPMTLKAMLADPDIKNHSNITYHAGFRSVSLYGAKAYMHDGIWGTQLLYLPEYNCSIAINYTNEVHERLLKKVVLTIKKLNGDD